MDTSSAIEIIIFLAYIGSLLWLMAEGQKKMTRRNCPHERICSLCDRCEQCGNKILF